MAHRSRFRLLWQLWEASRADASDITALQRRRFRELLSFARSNSEFYADHYDGLSGDVEDITDLPPVEKPQLMRNFDDWVTDPTIDESAVREFANDPSTVGRLYQGRYVTWMTSGTSGTHGLFLHDRFALSVYNNVTRFYGSGSPLRSFLPSFDRSAAIFVTGAHHTAVWRHERYRDRSPLHARLRRVFSVQQPLGELVSKLNDYQPDTLSSYASVLSLLAREREAGNLRIDPDAVVSAGERLTPDLRATIEAAFDCTVRNFYAATEFPPIAAECPEGRLHAFADWLVLEPVDEDYEPVAPGETSETVLLTNLANRVQPLVRYDLGDSIRMFQEDCPCGSPLPVIEVEGRHDDILRFETDAGEVPVSPVTVVGAVSSVSGVRRYQVLQTGKRTLTVRLDPVSDVEPGPVWDEFTTALRELLSAQGIDGVEIERSDEPCRRNPESGKYRQVRNGTA